MNTPQSKRQLSPYELNHLRRYGRAEMTIEELGEMPVEYATGKVEFAGRVFKVNHDVLIPRVESEELVELVVGAARQRPADQPLAIADIGTGAGALGLSIGLNLLAEKRSVEVWLADVSSPAVAVAQQNLAMLVPAAQQSLFHPLTSDLLKEFPAEPKFDIIVANLPYIPSQRVEYLPESVKDFEPHVALDGGPEGLTLMWQLLDQATIHLKPEGMLFLEIDYTHDTIDFADYSDRYEFKLHKDQFGQHRFIEVRRKS